MKSPVIRFLLSVVFRLFGYSIPKKIANAFYKGVEISDDATPFEVGKYFKTVDGRIIEVRKLFKVDVSNPHATFVDQYGHERHAAMKGSTGRSCGCSFTDPSNILPFNRPNIHQVKPK